ncbi:MAG: TadE/TadG family type IV pilus assembly protein [Anaerolineae bacterium]
MVHLKFFAEAAHMIKLKRNGQGLVEFALILPILIIILLGIAEGAHVIQAYLAAQSAVREAARYAVSGQPLNPQTGDPWTYLPEDRVEFIKNIAIEHSVGTGYTNVITDVTQYDTYRNDATCDETCAGVLGVRVDQIQYDVEGNSIIVKPDDPGIEGQDVQVSLYNNVPLWDPIYSAIVPNGYFRIEASIVMRNEGGQPITGAQPPFEGGGSGNPGSGGSPPSSTPLIEIQDGDQHPAGATIFIRIRFHTKNTPYDIYVDNVRIGSVTADASGNAIIPYPIPIDKPAGTYTVESRALDGTQVAATSLTVTQSTVAAIITNGDVWPFGSLLEYSLVTHKANADFDMQLVKGADTKILPPLSTDASGNSVGSGSYIIPNDGSLAAGAWTIQSLSVPTASVAATRTLTLLEGCIKLNQGACGEMITVPGGVYVNILLESHAYNRQYVAILVKPDGTKEEINNNVVTDGDGTAFLTYLIPLGAANGIYSIITEDAANPGYTIAQTDLKVDTPTDAFIHVDGGYTWPAGSTILFSLRKHSLGINYDVYWEGTRIKTNVGPTTDYGDGMGTLELQYTIPISIQGVYHLQSKPSPSSSGAPYTAVSFDITVTPSPYLEIAEGTPQIPGAPVTVLLKNHAINTQYDVYVLENITACNSGDAAGRLLPDNPVTTDNTGNSSIRYAIPANIQGKVHIRSYLKGTTTNPAASFCLNLVAADLQIAKIEVPSKPVFNSDVPITITVVNTAPVTITHRSFDVDVYLDPAVEPNLGRSLPPGDLKDWLQPPMGAYATRTFTTTLPIFGAFDHRIYARADTSDRVVESDELNNRLLKLISPTSCEIEYDATIFDPANIRAYGDTDLNPPNQTEKLRINTTGTSTWKRNDNAGNSGFPFAHRAISGDFQAQVRLTAPATNANKWGIEIREDTSGTAPKVDWGYYKGRGKLQAQSRKSNGRRQSGYGPGFPHPATTPLWIRVVRTGNTFDLYHATDTGNGTHGAWTKDKTYTNNMNAGVLVGLFASAYSNRMRSFDYNYYRICTAGSNCDDNTADGHILYQPTYNGTIDAGWTFTPFGNAASPAPSFTEEVPGSYTPFTVSNGTVTMDNNGLSITKANDGAPGATDRGYLFGYHQLSGNFDMRVRVVDIQNPGGGTPATWASAGLEIRSSLDKSANKIDWVKQYNRKLRYQYRDNNSYVLRANRRGGEYSSVWLRIVRDNDTFSLYYANGTNQSNPDNVSWVLEKTFVANTGSMTSTVFVGLLNASYQSGAKTTATFDNYHICGNPGQASSCGEVREATGLVVLNATNYVKNIPRSGKSWSTTPSPRQGKTGMWVGGSGSIFNGSNYTSISPELQYGIDFTNVGRYYIWLLGWRPGGRDNSAYVGLTNKPPSNNGHMTNSNNYNQLVWFNTANNGVNYIDVTSVGPQTLSVWMREDGFELHQIILTKDPNYDPTNAGDPLNIFQSQCSAAGAIEPPPGLQQCQSALVNGNFEDDTLMSEWHYAGIQQQVTRTSVPHYFAQGESFSMLLPATTLFGVPRQPWLYQDFVMPTWVLTPTTGGGTSLNLKLHVAVNPDVDTSPRMTDTLNALIRNQVGQPLDPTSVTGDVPVVKGDNQPFIDPNNPSGDNSEWVRKSINLAQSFNPVDYKGQTMRLFLESPNPGPAFSYRTKFYVDNVDLEICTAQPVPTSFSTKVAGEVLVFKDVKPVEQPGVFVWIYAIDGSMEKTYTIQDSTFSFYDLPAKPGGTQYILYAEYTEDQKTYIASTVIILTPGQVIEDISLVLF